MTSYDQMIIFVKTEKIDAMDHFILDGNREQPYYEHILIINQVCFSQTQRDSDMKIAVSSSGKDLTSQVDPRFGRTAFFVIVDDESMDCQAVENRQHLYLPQGAGIQAAQTVAAQKVDTVITGNCGPKAFRVLQAAGIQIVTGARGSIADVIRRYNRGEYQPADAANVEGHWM